MNKKSLLITLSLILFPTISIASPQINQENKIKSDIKSNSVYSYELVTANGGSGGNGGNGGGGVIPMVAQEAVVVMGEILEVEAAVVMVVEVIMGQVMVTEVAKPNIVR
ncbi:hypothetical protein RN24_20280 [Yersinia pestis subsp. microtus bv. Ulegeica]|nr:hypothetical protein [Yersinia pestis]KJG82855.1 hypothetical protein RN24_20280 [Yersinia pestis subsp. microtus bv. Ulegeica]